MSRILDEHRQLLADDVRLRAFESALNEIIRPDDVVLDLASGTGILGFLACRAGARHVYSVDDGGIIELSKELARENGLAGRITYVKAPSTRAELPERVDLVVADQIGHFGFEPGIVQCFEDARRRLLKPGGRFMPRRIHLRVSAVSAPEIRQRIEFWRTPRFGLNLTAALPTALNSGYPLKLDAAQVLGSDATIATIDFVSVVPDVLKGETTLTIERDAVMHGLGGWFVAELSEHVSMTNSPVQSPAIGRRNVVLPIETPVAVQRGDRVNVAMTIVHAQTLVRWSVEVVGAAGLRKASSDHSTWRGMLLSSEDLERTRPGRSVTLTPWGVARLTVLELCDGRRTSAEIESALLARHPDLFPAPADAALFVAEVVIPYSQ